MRHDIVCHFQAGYFVETDTAFSISVIKDTLPKTRLFPHLINNIGYFFQFLSCQLPDILNKFPRALQSSEMSPIVML